MEVQYSDHLILRLNIRGIPYELPRIVYERATRRFYDTQSHLNIGLLRTSYLGKKRDVAVTYRVYTSHILLVTIHPLKPNQLVNRLYSGRWKEVS